MKGTILQSYVVEQFVLLLSKCSSPASASQLQFYWVCTSIFRKQSIGIIRRHVAFTAQSVQWLGYGLDDQGSIPGRDLDFFPLADAARQGLGPIHPPTQWVQSVLSPGVKRPRCEADHSPPSTMDYGIITLGWILWRWGGRVKEWNCLRIVSNGVLRYRRHWIFGQ
jgi:hypothetical protein